MTPLQSKLQPPKRPAILRRDRLTRVFETIDHKKLFTVLAGAGFGKTTLVIDALSRLDMASAWYRLDRQDMDFHVFMSYLYAMVGAVDGDSIPTPGINTHTQILIDWLGFTEAVIKAPVAIILDDYHLVQESEEINQAVDFILHRLPANVHLIIMGRKELPLALSRLRAQDQLGEINEHELAFSRLEITSFFHGYPMVTRADIDQILNTTKGWAASLVLLRYTFHRHIQKGIPINFDQIRKKPDYIFSYLKENIFDIQPDHVRHFLMQASLLPEIDARQCEKIFNIRDARRILNRLIEDHLLIFPVDASGQVFYLHHLFRDFLREQLAETYDAPAVCDLHCRIGEILAPDDISQALYHFIAGQNYDRAISVITTCEMEFLLAGKIHFLGRQIEKIPERYIKQHPRLLLSLSRLYSHFGDPEKSIELISRALRLFKLQNAPQEMIDCVIELGSQYYFSGHPREAMQLMEQVLDDIDPKSQTYIFAMTFLTFLPSVLGEFDTAKEFDRTAREVVAGYPDATKHVATALLDTSLGHTLYFKGEFEASQHLCKKLLATVQALTIEPCLPLVYFQLSANSYYLGEYASGCGYARNGIDACEKMSLTDSRKAWVYFSWALNSLGLGQTDEVFDTLGKCIPLFEQPGNRWGLASAWDCMAQAYRIQGKTARAKNLLEKALEMIRGYGLTITRGILNTTYAAVLLDENEYQTALKTLLASRQELNGAAYHLFRNYLLTARAHFHLGSLPDALAGMASAADLSMTYAYDHFIVREKSWVVRLLTRASDTACPVRPQVRAYLETLLESESDRPHVLRIGLLGKFTLRLGDREIGPSDWKSAKALMILKYLAASRSQGYVHRERLIELLWPEQDPQKTAARFNMAMSALRKTLEPELAPKAPSTYIDRKKDTYRLFDDQRVEIDSERFSALLPTALQIRQEKGRALSCYLDALEVYQGDFLEEDPYEDWCIEIREAFSRDHAAALGAVVRMLEKEKELDQAIFYAEKLFHKAPLDEACVEKLMCFYAKAGTVSKVKSTYDRYARAARQYGLPVSETLTASRHDLVKI